MRYLRFIFGICALSLIIATTAFGHSLEYRAGRAAAHIDYCGKYDLNRALYKKYGKCNRGKWFNVEINYEEESDIEDDSD